MKRLLTFCTFFLLIGINPIWAQPSASKLISTGDKFKKQADYSPALRSYKQALRLEPKNTKALNQVVDIYLYKYELYDSAAVYIDRKLKTMSKDTSYGVFLDHANCLRLQEKHTEAIKTYNFYLKHGLKKAKNGALIVQVVKNRIIASQNALNNQELIYEPLEVENMDFFVNSVDAEYTPVYIESENLLLYNARYKDYDNEHMDADNLYFENIYYFDVEESVASTYNSRIDQTTHQCVVGKVWSSDSILVFYQNKIWISSIAEDRLNKLQPLPEELGSYYFQPHGVFSKNQDRFIFTAREEYGNLDIFESIKTNGIWSAPENISIRINSTFDEDAPFLSADGKKLYFSSKGHNSSGGYDFFVSELKDGEWSTPMNMGYPMNSAGDDIYISWNEDEKSGYFSSNRNGGFGGMDIYTFGTVLKTVRGTVTDKKGNPLPEAEIKLIDFELGEIESIFSDANGDYSFLADPERKFELKGTKDKYFGDANSLDTYGEADIIISNLSLEKDPGISLFIEVMDAETGEHLDSVIVTILDNLIDRKDSTMTDASGTFIKPLPDKKLQDRGSFNIRLVKQGYLVMSETYNVLFDREGQYNVLEDLHIKLEKIEVGLDLTKVMDIKPIYFDLGKYKIRKDAGIELDKIVTVMNDNPKMVIELGSHTDARGSAKSNQSLSDKRAKASSEYIKTRITKPERISGKGYGEVKLVNHCADGVQCSEDEHQENRRTEFIIIEM
ncbi:MAG: outer membrane protein OmpA-like peptidoglycan-associated protein [Arenicella sp.]|jgi:outer membrane protein OmpA-like peptidoglycan-associated protein